MSKILININELSELEEYKKIGISNFLFAVENLSIGYNTFKTSDIPTDAYILINRVLDNKAIDELKLIKDDLLRFRGIIYEDVGVYNLFKNEKIELIWFQNHFNTNYSSINFWLDNGCESAIIGNEITRPEIEEIVNKSNKPLILNIFGKNQIMYSRRTLLSNFNEYAKIENENDVVLHEEKTKVDFLARECENGTVLFNNTYFNYFKLIDALPSNKIKYYLIMNLDLTPNQIISIINGEEIGDDGFLNKKTVYKMSEYTDR